MPENISRGGLSTDQAFEVGVMTEGNISNKKSYYCIYYQDRLKNYQRETKLFQFSRDWLRVEDKINDVTLQRFGWTGWELMASFAMDFTSLVCLYLQT